MTAAGEHTDVEHWDAFWRARDKAIEQEDAGARDPAPAEFWAAFFGRELGARRRARIADVACGNGAVTRIAVHAAGQTDAKIGVCCFDYSRSAVDEVRKQFPMVDGVACDARAIPCTDGEFDIVVSQFGIEYAGTDAFREAARLVAEDGVFAAIVHLAGGAIFRECADNLGVARSIRDAGLLPLARDAFAAGFDLIAGKITNPEFQAADKQLAPAVEAAKQILRDKGPLAAGGFLARLYRDIGHMYTRMQNYVPAEVFAWLDGMTAELVSYEGRMESMTRCALDGSGIRSVAESLAATGLTVDPPGILELQASGEAAAWILLARRNPAAADGP